MAHQGFDLQLTRYDERGWRATFYTTGMEHSPTSATGTGWKRTSWHDAAGGVGCANAGARSRTEGRAMTMATWTKIALALTVLGTVGVGVLPMIGRTTASGGEIRFRSPGWRSSWLVAWLVFMIGVALTAYVR